MYDARSIMRCRTTIIVTIVLAVAPWLGAAAQSPGAPACHLVCAPSISLTPTLLRSHLFGGPRVEKLSTQAVQRLSSRSHLELIVVAAMKTAIPRLTLFGSVQWLPNATQSSNPFTEYTASELGGPVHANAPTATVGLSGGLLSASQSHGIVDVGVNVGDLYSQAARPNDRSSYTSKLDLDLVTHWHVFAWASSGTYARRLTVLGMLDYIASGLPRAGDEVPKGRVFLTNARPTSLLVGLVIPITPEAR